ncbi:hypothetical protein H5410_044217 [Solanum commersonii]|uniref:Uncharacterized protein n=1 Tax=Solanum commersonii TaxID=4109 RepID=A0A9J5X7U7_SOLCO|nr:hypothetical protein H5410_044217 [Solanum commersonii]
MSNKWGQINKRAHTDTPTLAHSTLHRSIENETPLSLSLDFRGVFSLYTYMYISTLEYIRSFSLLFKKTFHAIPRRFSLALEVGTLSALFCSAIPFFAFTIFFESIGLHSVQVITLHTWHNSFALDKATVFCQISDSLVVCCSFRPE